MSFILEALNRSRESANPVPTLSTEHPVEPVGAGLRQYIPWAVLVLALVVVAWLVWGRLAAQPEPPPATASQVAELTQNIGIAATAVTTELKARAEARTQGAQPVAPSQPAPAEQPAAVPQEPEQPARTAQETSAAAVTEEPEAVQAPATEDSAVARLYRDRSVPDETPAAATSAREEQPLDIKHVLKRAQEEMDNSGADEHPVPLLTSLSQQVKNDIPTLYYQRHDYSNNAAQSEVTLNGKSVKAGGSPGSGFKVEEILPDSVVMSYRGTQFRLRALNSWVNL